MAEPKACEVCGKIFRRPPSLSGPYCSKSCAKTAANRTSSNPAFYRDIRGENNPMFGVKRLGPANPMFGKRSHLWKGGRKVRNDGYVLIWQEKGYKLEHRIVMEQVLGRPLKKAEVVHHIDENRGNNDPSNLMLLENQSAHARLHKGNGWTPAPGEVAGE